MDMLAVLNPYTGAEVGRVVRGGVEEVNRAVAVAQRGARIMRAMPLNLRAAILSETARLLTGDTEAMARLITSEAGKTIREARAEVARTAGIFALAAEETRRLHGETMPFDALAGGEGRTGYWTREPVGIVGAITPLERAARSERAQDRPRARLR